MPDVLILGVINARSVCNKALDVRDMTMEYSLDVVCITETWLHGDIRDDPILVEMTPEHFKTVHHPRLGRGGGIGVLMRDELSPISRSRWEMRAMECLDITLHTKPPLRLITIYRPPSGHFASFLDEMDNLMTDIILCGGHLLVTGDFNVHVDDDQNNADGRDFVRLMESYGMDQHVQGVTHVAGHTLDLIFTRSMNAPSEVEIIDACLSDHMLVKCRLPLSKPSKPRREVVYRRLRDIDLRTFKTDISNSNLMEVGVSAESYNVTMRSILDRHAPPRATVIPQRSCPWFNANIRTAKQERRAAERRWRTTQLQTDKDEFIQKKKQAMCMLEQAKSEFYSAKIAENSKDSKKLFAVTSELLGRQKEMVLPSAKGDAELAENFSIFFVDKVKLIRESLPPPLRDPIIGIHQRESSLHHWDWATPQEVEQIIRKCPNKSCPLDPLPTNLLKECLETLIPCITGMMNDSLATGVVPTEFKKARVIPTLKNGKLDPEQKSSYRPVSNLSFLSKVLEKLILTRLQHYLQQNGIGEQMQSAYKQMHSTETALIRVYHDLVKSLSAGRPSIVALLDLSAAFDTVDHMLLLDILKKYGVEGTSLSWFESYLTGREQTVIVRNESSNPQQLSSGVPQGSVLGPVLFNLYTSALGDLLRSHSMEFHLYADDSTVYLSFKPENIDETFHRMERCLDEVQKWMGNMRLKMNPSKTELLLISSRRGSHRIGTIPVLSVAGDEAKPTEVARLLGVHFDKHLLMDRHVDLLCRSAWFHLRNISRIRRCLPYDACESLIHAFVTSRIDYCNALLYALPKNRIQKIQKVQNAAARILRKVPKREHITPVLKAIHWLPVPARIEFKILVTVFKCIQGTAPPYLQELVRMRDLPRTDLRSTEAPLLHCPRSSSQLEMRAFGTAAPALWNDLPPALRRLTSLDIFKCKLKTHLFLKFYQ